ncbi:N-acetyl-glucosamine transferase [Serinicoccus hydrothermalis]|uniref:N-acetyl-glucosamine transferase n=1 Tax=Serinicoccus hydrothermalis TaxID=1758689 RepID=A0A1B1NCR6_9MICO|nr:glycosyltransferase family 2 protein [Serinicoccus hydrothermalis]ANS79216.1 N-acetyl-glucosamine transferase [Serinicoccus hydrothermalis]
MLTSSQVDPVATLAVALVLLSVAYLVRMLVLSRRTPQHTVEPQIDLTQDPGYDVVFLVPCLDEELVLGGGIERLLALPHPRMSVLVVDDGSQDATAAVARSFDDPRVHLLQRFAPEARLGKGEALNAAVAHLLSGGLGRHFDPDGTIVCVVDADGRLEEQSLHAVLPKFVDPVLGGVQIGVRINNRRSDLLARMQDMEFVLYTDVFQRGRRHLGSVGLGGNGQFVRLSALMSLGSAPWTRSLSEDLDLGVRLLTAGWRLDFSSDAAVHQQGLVDLGRWVRQRTRWFQGHLQAWGLVPRVLDSLKGSARIDLYYHLTSPFLLLVASLFSVAFTAWVLDLVTDVYTGELEPSWWWVTSYAFAVGPTLVLTLLYRRREPDLPVLTAFALAHVYVAYSMLWYAAGWRAVGRTLRGRTGWAKTERLRTVEEEPAPAEPLGLPAR